MFILEFFALICFGTFVALSVGIIYYLFVLKEKGQLKYKQFQDLIDQLGGTSKPKKSVRKKEAPHAKTKVEDAEFREVK